MFQSVLLCVLVCVALCFGLCCSMFQSADLPHDTDYPYPIRSLTVFKVIRPYSIVIRILTKFMDTLFFNHIVSLYASQNYSTME